MVLVEVLLSIASAFLAFYLYAIYKYGYWKRRGVPQSDTSFPFGSLKGLSRTKSLGEVFKQLYDESKGLRFYGVYQGLRPSLVIRDPELIKQVLVKDFTSFHDRGPSFDTEKDPLANHLFFIKGKRWRNMRIKLAPTFTAGKMKMMFSTLLKTSEELLEFLKEPANNGAVIDVKDVFAKFTTNVIARVAFGIELDSFKKANTEFREMSAFLFKPNLIQSIKNILFLTAPKIMNKTPFHLVPENTNTFFIKVVEDTMKFREDNKIERNDFLQMLIQLKNVGHVKDTEIYSHGQAVEDSSSDATKFSVKDAAAQAFVFFVAGFETASTTLQFTMYELAANPQYQDKLREEIDKALAQVNGELSYEVVQSVTYLEQIVSETLRKYPPASVILREANAPVKLGDSDVVLEKGTQIMVPLLGVHRNPDNFPDPLKFDPDRFAPENKDKIGPNSYMPFGDGPRTCIGMRFGLLQTKLGLLQFIRNYKVELCSESPEAPLKFDPKSILLALNGKMFLKVTNR